MSRSPQDDYSDEFDDSEEEDFRPKPKPERVERPTKITNHKRPPKNHEKVINLGSVGTSTKKKTTKRPVSAGTMKKASRPAVEYWNDSLRRTGVGLTTQSSANTMTGLSKKQRKDMAYSSTTHFLRQLAGTEKAKRATVTDSQFRAAPGTPAYKSPEEYYDEILDLKKQITGLNQDNSQMKSKVRRLEEDNLKKEREIEQLLDPTKSEELRRTLADRKPDAGVVIHSLKQKILKLEHQLKDREAAHSRLQGELKTTKIEELKLQVETFYNEIVRLNQVKSVDSSRSRHHREEPVKENNHAKLKALQETILRMNEKSFRLTAENKSLKQDLEKTMDDLARAKERQRKHQSDHDEGRRNKHDKRGDHYDADTVSMLSEIESRHGNIEGKMTLEGSIAQRLDQLDRRETELLEDAEKQRKLIKQLKEERGHYRKKAEEREKELKVLRKEVDSLNAQMEEMQERDRRPPSARSSVTPRHSAVLSNAAAETPRRGSRSGRGSGSRSPSLSSEKGSRHEDRKSQRELDDEAYRRARAEHAARLERFREKHAARTIQRGWREHHNTKSRLQEEVGSYSEESRKRECEERAEAFRRKRAASKIQSGWISHQSRKREAELDDTTEFLQSTFRGHLSRKSQIEAYRNRPPSRTSSLYDDDESVTESELDSEAELIQSNMRGHLTRKEQLRKRSTSRSPSSSRRSSAHFRQRLDSAGEEEDEEDKQSYLSRGSKRSSGRDSGLMLRKPPASPRKYSYSSRRDDDDDDDDSDDDIIVTSGRR